MTDSGQLRLGILGAGRITQKAIAPAALKARNAELVAVASRDLDRASALGAKRAYGSYDELIAQPDIDVVFNTTHNGLHAELTIDALERGKHVICEKPLGLDAEECAEMAREAGRRNLRLMEAFMYRFHPQIAALVEAVKAGRIGEVMRVDAAFQFHLDRPDDVRLQKIWGGGALLDVGCYCVNITRLLLGDDPEDVSASAMIHPRHGVDMETRATLKYSGGATAVLTCGFVGPFNQRVVVHGSEGTATLPAPFVTREERGVLILSAGGRTERTEFDRVDPYQLEIEEFCDAVLENREPMLAPDDGAKNARILDRIADAISGA